MTSSSSSSSTSHSLAIPKGSLVLVTGVTGFIANHVAHEFLALGYRVRGTVRSTYKGAWIASTLAALQPSGQNEDFSSVFETVIVPDMADEAAFDHAVQGCAAVVHVASNVSFKPDPNVVIPETIAGVKAALRAAAKEPSVKRFVLTSSAAAALLPKPNTRGIHVDKNTWDDEAVAIAWAPPPYTEERSYATYSASKTQGERALWDFVAKEKPTFVANAVVPNANLGRILNERQKNATTAGWVPTLVDSIPPALRYIPPQYFINVTDDARLHVAATIDPDVQNERIFAWAEPFNWNDILATIRKVMPADHQTPDDIPDLARDLSTVDNELGKILLKKWWGQEGGYVGLEQSVKENLEKNW